MCLLTFDPQNSLTLDPCGYPLDPGLMFSHVFIDIFLPDMRFSRGFINICPLEFLDFGSLGYPLDALLIIHVCFSVLFVLGCYVVAL